MNSKNGNFIGFSVSSEGDNNFKAFSPVSNELLPKEFFYASHLEFEQAVALGENAFSTYSETSYVQRAEFLETVAEKIRELGHGLIDICSLETGLPKGRLESERARTCNQLKMFAELLREGWWLDARIDTSDTKRFERPISYQDFPDHLLPDSLKNSNPLNIPRLVKGRREQTQIEVS